MCVDFLLFCGYCCFCCEGRGNLCENWNVIGVMVDGGCVQYVLVLVVNAFVLLEDVEWCFGMIVELLLCVVCGFDQLQVWLVDYYLIYGVGMMGLFFI